MTDRPIPPALPTFLGIGVPRAGTTWLHGLLSSHPQVVMPAKRKELDYFHHNFDRGLGWYTQAFESAVGDVVPLAVGEVSPSYYCDPVCIDRIKATVPDVKFVVMVREPVGRLVSEYRMWRANLNDDQPFDTFVEGRPLALEMGNYGSLFSPWVEAFGRERFLFMNFEAATQDVDDLARQLGEFLGIDPALFPRDALEPSNESRSPKRKRLYSLMRKTSRRLRELDVDWIPNLGARLGLTRFVGTAEVEAPVASHDTLARYRALYRPEVTRFAALTGMDVSGWASAAPDVDGSRADR